MKNLTITPGRGEIKREFSQKEIDDIVVGLIDDSISLEDVPSCIHSRLFTPLSLARNEAKLGNQAEKYNHINDVIWSLKLTLAQPDKSLMPQMEISSSKKSTNTRNIDTKNQTRTLSTHYHKDIEDLPEVSLVSAIKKEEHYTKEATIKRLQGIIDTTREFYDDEEKHLNDMKNKEYSKLCKTFKMQEIPQDKNEAQRHQDEFELQLVDSRNKWSEKIKKLQEEKQREISDLEAELSLYNKPHQEYEIFDMFNINGTDQYTTFEDQMEAIQAQQSRPQSSRKSPKRMTQTNQPNQKKKIADKR